MKVTLIRSLLAVLLVACLTANFACGPTAKFELGALNISPTEVLEGSAVTVSVDVTNAGEAGGNFEAKLKIDNTLAETKSVSIAAGETKTVSFTVDAAVSGIHDVKLNDLAGTFSVMKPPQFANLTINPTQARVGEQVIISAEISNTGEIAGNYTVALKINNVDEETKTVMVNTGVKETISFTLTENTPGTYSITLGSLSGTITILKPAGFTMSNLVISPTQAIAGRAVSIMCDVANTGDVEGACPVSLKVNGVQADSKEVTVAAGATQTVAFSLVKDIGGTYNVAIGELTGNLVVSEGVLPTLYVGDQWIYREISEGIAYTVTQRVVGEELIQGKQCYIIERTYDPPQSGISKETFWVEKATLDAIRMQYSVEVSGVTLTCSIVAESEYSGDQRWPRKVANEWTEIATVTRTYEALGDTDTETFSLTLHYKVEKIEEVTVGAGTFRCFKIVISQDGVVTDTYWYADKAKAEVKIDDLTDNDTEQLLSYSVK